MEGVESIKDKEDMKGVEGMENTEETEVMALQHCLIVCDTTNTITLQWHLIGIEYNDNLF